MTPRPAPTGVTVVTGVIGDPVYHSLSPILHNAAFAASDLDWTYVALPVAVGSGAEAVEAMRTLGIRGLSVTMPHKYAAAEAADRRSTDVEVLGAANCLVLDHDGLITAHNTDGAGFLDGLVAAAGQSVAGRSVLVFGAGGAARAVIVACARAGASEIVVVNRSEERGRAAVLLAGELGRLGSIAAVPDVEIVVNATPVGMGTDPSVPFDPVLLNPSHLVIDLIYDPWESGWLMGAREQGATVINGFPMLLHQAGAQFSLWTGRDAPTDEMERAVRQRID